MYTICEKCEIHHYENCKTCRGFGVYTLANRKSEIFPVDAYDAIHHIKRGEQKPCPECGSTVEGVPQKELA